jgi:hypothetical protein
VPSESVKVERDLEYVASTPAKTQRQQFDENRAATILHDAAHAARLVLPMVN